MKPQYKEARWSTNGTSDLPEALSYEIIKYYLVENSQNANILALKIQ